MMRQRLASVYRSLVIVSLGLALTGTRHNAKEEYKTADELRNTSHLSDLPTL